MTEWNSVDVSAAMAIEQLRNSSRCCEFRACKAERDIGWVVVGGPGTSFDYLSRGLYRSWRAQTGGSLSVGLPV